MNRASTSSTTGDAASSNTDSTPNFCGHCGEPDDGGSRPPSDPHLPCRELLVLEPPRYCAACGRRMKVQVTPTGWSAECSRHGVLVR
ncbi:biotin synthase auxiliary protein BsaP [Arthrobacter humicola]|jgi:NADH pyrophosphatase NudC (nudix superfamily)